MKRNDSNVAASSTDESNDSDYAFVRLAGHVLAGRLQDATLLSRRVLRNISKSRPELQEVIKVAVAGTLASPATRTVTALPVDLDSRMELVKREEKPELEIGPVWTGAVKQELDAILRERQQVDALLDAGLTPTRSLLLIGPPGVGKTLSARWLASQLNLPLLTLNLASVMSSYLGRTGSNIRTVVEFAQKSPCVLLLDEFDAIAKRRDDVSELGELKRLVTVLLQSIDEWPGSGLLIAATNHPELLDPAIWRRFERTITFPLPSIDDLKQAISDSWQVDAKEQNIQLAAELLFGSSFADAARHMGRVKKEAVLSGIDVDRALTESILSLRETLSKESLLRVAKRLYEQGFSQRSISDRTGIARDTLRSHNIGTENSKETENGTKQ